MSAFDYLNQSIIDIVSQIDTIKEALDRQKKLVEGDLKLLKMAHDIALLNPSGENIQRILDANSDCIESKEFSKELEGMISDRLDELTHRIIHVQDFLP